MTEKRYKVHNMIKGMNVGESVDLELMKELIEKYGAYEYVDVGITNNGKEMTYKEVVDLLNENEQLKSDNKEYIKGLELAKATSQSWATDVRELREENCRLEKENERLIKKIKRERASTTKQHLKWSDEAEEIINDLRKENKQLKYEVNSLMEDLGYIDAELEELEDIDKNVIE